MKKRIYLLCLLLCLCLTASACGGSPAESTPETETTAATEANVPTTEPQPVYETQTVYLCVKQTKTSYDIDSVFTTEMAYNEYGQLIEKWSTDADGNKTGVTTYAYDEQGNRVEEITQYGRSEMTYDEQGRLLSECYYADDICKSEYHYTYDDAGFVVEETRISRYSDEKIETYQITYNPDYTEALVNHYLNGEASGYTKETYDANGNVLTSNSYDANDTWTGGSTYEYDAQGRLAVEWRYSSRETQADYDIIYTYDENGLLVSKNVDYYYGSLTEYTYEPFDILVRVN